MPDEARKGIGVLKGVGESGRPLGARLHLRGAFAPGQNWPSSIPHRVFVLMQRPHIKLVFYASLHFVSYRVLYSFLHFDKEPKNSQGGRWNA